MLRSRRTAPRRCSARGHRLPVNLRAIRYLPPSRRRFHPVFPGLLPRPIRNSIRFGRITASSADMPDWVKQGHIQRCRCMENILLLQRFRRGFAIHQFVACVMAEDHRHRHRLAFYVNPHCVIRKSLFPVFRLCQKWRVLGTGTDRILSRFSALPFRFSAFEFSDSIFHVRSPIDHNAMACKALVLPQLFGPISTTDDPAPGAGLLRSA